MGGGGPLVGGPRAAPSPSLNTEIRLIIFFAAKDGEAIYSQQKQDQELTVAQTQRHPEKLHEVNAAKAVCVCVRVCVLRR